MELHAVHLIRPMANGHDGAVFFRALGHLEIRRHAVAGDHERVITARKKRLVDSREHALLVVDDGRRLAVHRRRRAAYRPAIHHADRLMSQAYAEDRRAWTK